MTRPYDPDLFAGTAAYYRRCRAPYAGEALAHVARALSLDGHGRLLDLGCGPGTLAVPLSTHVDEVLAMDPDPGMLQEGRLFAAEQNRRNIRWLRAGSYDLSGDLGRFRAAVMGQSFHWMDRDAVLTALLDLIEPGGALALVNPGRRRPQESWERIVDPIRERFLGPSKIHPQRSPEGPHEPALPRSSFDIVEYLVLPGAVRRDSSGVIGVTYSSSGGARRLFGERAGLFETEVREALAAAFPASWIERIETGVIIARAPGVHGRFGA
jgi:SAM-dependent methyltransferase